MRSGQAGMRAPPSEGWARQRAGGVRGRWQERSISSRPGHPCALGPLSVTHAEGGNEPCWAFPGAGWLSWDGRTQIRGCLTLT